MTLSDSQRRYYAKSSQAYHADLMTISPGNDPAGVIPYFKTHGISFDIAGRYGLGFVANPLAGDERFAGRIAIPYYTPEGCVAINFRALGEATPKYLKPHGQRSRLYNAQAYFDAGDTIGLCEGEIDAIAATEHLGIPSVGVGGVQTFVDRWTHLFMDFERVVVFTDGDDAGKDFGERMADLIGWRVRTVACPAGEDVASMCAAGHASVLIQLAAGGDE